MNGYVLFGHAIDWIVAGWFVVGVWAVYWGNRKRVEGNRD